MENDTIEKLFSLYEIAKELNIKANKLIDSMQIIETNHLEVDACIDAFKAVEAKSETERSILDISITDIDAFLDLLNKGLEKHTTLTLKTEKGN